MPPSEPFTITLPMPPSSNSLFPGQRRRYRSAEYEAWITEAGWELKRQRPPKAPGRVAVLIVVGEPKGNLEFDLPNREKATVDLLVTHQVIRGDSNRCVRKLTMEWADIEGVRVTITPLD